MAFTWESEEEAKALLQELRQETRWCVAHNNFRLLRFQPNILGHFLDIREPQP